MALGLGVLGLEPGAFWRTTPRELDAMLRGRFGQSLTGDALSKSELASLMHLFPD